MNRYRDNQAPAKTPWTIIPESNRIADVVSLGCSMTWANLYSVGWCESECHSVQLGGGAIIKAPISLQTWTRLLVKRNLLCTICVAPPPLLAPAPGNWLCWKHDLRLGSAGGPLSQPGKGGGGCLQRDSAVSPCLDNMYLKIWWTNCHN